MVEVVKAAAVFRKRIRPRPGRCRDMLLRFLTDTQSRSAGSCAIPDAEANAREDVVSSLTESIY